MTKYIQSYLSHIKNVVTHDESIMIPELQLPVTRRNASGIFLALFNLTLFLVLRSDIQRMRRNHALRYNQRAQRKGVPKNIRRTAINLSGDDASAVSYCLLDADC